MLKQAEHRVEENGWTNVELVQSDAAKYDFPQKVNAVFSSFALTLVPEFETVIQRAHQSLAPGGRLVILDLKLPGNWPRSMIQLALLITRPFGVTLDLGERKPWLIMQKYFPDTRVKQLYGGFAYIAVGER
jgi:demethylmenaquinone methyltransferase/2-methoxy-6-polyprenyl-1,4-benzoquinol methylase